MTATFKTRKDGWWRLADLLVGTPQEFNRISDTFRGRTDITGYGWLPENTREQLRAVEREVEFAIYSYETPIAWLAGGEWVIPDVTYSGTTTRHQNLVRTAIGQIRQWQDEARSGRSA